MLAISPEAVAAVHTLPLQVVGMAAELVMHEAMARKLAEAEVHLTFALEVLEPTTELW